MGVCRKYPSIPLLLLDTKTDTKIISKPAGPEATMEKGYHP